MYDLGIRLNEENIEEARTKLGLKAPTDECDFQTFEAWWNRGPGVSASVRQHLLANASEVSHMPSPAEPFHAFYEKIHACLYIPVLYLVHTKLCTRIHSL